MFGRNDDFAPDNGSGELRVAGQGMSEGSTKWSAGVWNLIKAAFITAFVVGGIVIDVVLMPFFLQAYAGGAGMQVDGIDQWLTWSLSIALTGLVYVLWDATLQGGFRNRSTSGKIIICVAWMIAFADALMDAGGFIAFQWGEEAGANILPPEATVVQWFAAIFFGGWSLMHERMSNELLGRRKQWHDRDDSFGAQLPRAAVWFSGWVLSIVKSLAIPVGILCMVVIDFVLTPQFLAPGGFAVWLAWLISAALTGFNFILWDHLFKVGIRKLKKMSLLIVGLAWVFAIGDTIMDVIGFTSAVYGNSEEVVYRPVQITLAWVLSALFLIGPLCLCAEPLGRELTWRASQGTSLTDMGEDLGDRLGFGKTPLDSPIVGGPSLDNLPSFGTGPVPPGPGPGPSILGELEPPKRRGLGGLLKRK